MSANIIILSNEQANTLLDLVTDQIRAQRVNLRRTPLDKTNIAALTHFRRLKHLILSNSNEESEEGAGLRVFEFNN
jgi:hypothetical protein